MNIYDKVIIASIILLAIIILLKRKIKNGSRMLSAGRKKLINGRKKVAKFSWIPYWAIPQALANGYSAIKDGERQIKKGDVIIKIAKTIYIIFILSIIFLVGLSIYWIFITKTFTPKFITFYVF